MEWIVPLFFANRPSSCALLVMAWILVPILALASFFLVMGNIGDWFGKAFFTTFISLAWLGPFSALYEFTLVNKYVLYRKELTESIQLFGVDLMQFKKNISLFLKLCWVLYLATMVISIGLVLFGNIYAFLIPFVNVIIFTIILKIFESWIVAKFVSQALVKNIELGDIKPAEIYKELRSIIVKKIVQPTAQETSHS